MSQRHWMPRIDQDVEIRAHPGFDMPQKGTPGRVVEVFDYGDKQVYVLVDFPFPLTRNDGRQESWTNYLPQRKSYRAVLKSWWVKPYQG